MNGPVRMGARVSHCSGVRAQGHTLEVITRTPGKGAYARIEREQRWLLSGVPVGVTEPVEILDKYVHETTLRLRRMRSGSTLVYKLAQKVRHNPASPSLISLTNMYLTEAEFDSLGLLNGAELIKTRWQLVVGDTTVSIDQFGSSLDGLVLAEVELDPDVTLEPPPLAVIDVTEDDRFSGGRLALLNPIEAKELLSSVAL
jgi:CYTH domain-containing protein